MIVSFSIEYRTNWGEEVRVCGSIPQLGNNDLTRALPLHSVDGVIWQADLELKGSEHDDLQYQYIVWDGKSAARREWNGVPRILRLNPKQQHYLLHDSWKDLPEELSFYSSAFTESLLAHTDKSVYQPGEGKLVVIKANAPTLSNEFQLGICGNQEQLGQWNPDKALLMSDRNFPEWTVQLNAAKLSSTFEYKFIVFHKSSGRAVAWEENPNRTLSLGRLKEGETLVIADRYVHFNLPQWKGAGVAVPVFSLRSEGSCGNGDFGDLKMMVAWAAKTHQKIVQILPINDTTRTHSWDDSYPYNSISIYALHPMYLDVRQLEPIKDKALAAAWEARREAVNNLTQMDYEASNQLKWEYIRLSFAQNGQRTLQSRRFLQFFHQNQEWLQPYAAFSYLRDRYHTANFHDWPQYSRYDAQQIEELCAPQSEAYPEIALSFYVQYHLHLQLRQVATYAHAHQVVLKGDIPIGISPSSVEAWKEPQYFNLNGQAGAPPDDFSANGQNWGFPTYNWEVMEKDGYHWWMNRFQKMAEYFDAYRIDHILGFFRIWEIPQHSVQGLLGQFVPALPMTREEIAGFGLEFREEFLHPYIHENYLRDVFGSNTEAVKAHFLEPNEEEGRYRLRAEYDTQRKVELYFRGRNDELVCSVRNGLYTLLNNVLFVPDRKDPQLYHPRIAAQNDYVFRALSKEEQHAFDCLHNHYFYERHNQFWQEQAMKKLPELTQSTRMLVCGEDLGMIPACVPWVMNALRILSLEIQRMPKIYGQEFGALKEYPYRSICSFSTHDMSTLREWWLENRSQTQRYYNFVLGNYGTAPANATASVCEDAVRAQLESNSLFCILSLQDWMSVNDQLRNPDLHAERINVPANAHHYWRYRMHLTLEELLQHEVFCNQVTRLIQTTGRDPQ